MKWQGVMNLESESPGRSRALRAAPAGAFVSAVDADMSETPIPMNVQSLIAECIDSAGSMELLLLLYREPHREWTCEEAAAELRVDRTWAREQMKEFVKHGLACETGNRQRYFRYYPASMEVNAAVAELARTYAERPLAVISFVHSRPVATLRRFAEAFRMRGGADEGA